MSFGEPNNPYGQPQGQGQQPGYGYPQQAPQGVPPQGYGYPAAPPVSPYGGGYPGAVMEMPGGVKAARVMMWIMGAFNLIGGVAAIGLSFTFTSELEKQGTLSGDEETFANLGQGIMIGAGVISLIFAVLGMVLAAKFKSGGNGVRIGAIVWASFAVLFSLFSLPLGIVSLALGIMVIVFTAKSDGSAWFNRNKQQY
ncbi:hypothetical protein GCM10010222_07300 [Streptomyces tanashiensis]|uniref:Integral membrane protein n=1 Tax=Streptomyces tanashiensis TaxID=67367 RepID=A0ABY6QY72_9ACTN|nr:hypothetical protein [Streptomyces tanashiensis]UZX22156.1 hypothetical protein LDH80_16100 [Streptomyces tanashiensis]GGS69048.1 hypothetical protein GCM10010222_07300 [Streptomyces tanashiensis]GGY05532.1 hypothetical protein GCM10010299_05980 [Streptomyces tanashiensis]